MVGRVRDSVSKLIGNMVSRFRLLLPLLFLKFSWAMHPAWPQLQKLFLLQVGRFIDGLGLEEIEDLLLLALVFAVRFGTFNTYLRKLKEWDTNSQWTFDVIVVGLGLKSTNVVETLKLVQAIPQGLDFLQIRLLDSESQAPTVLNSF